MTSPRESDCAARLYRVPTTMRPRRTPRTGTDHPSSYDAPERTRRSAQAVRRDAALAGFDELFAELLQEAKHRHGGPVGESTDGVAHHVVGDVDQQIDIFGFAFAAAQVVEHAVQPA